MPNTGDANATAANRSDSDRKIVFNYPVYVYENDQPGNPIAGATVHFEPRQSGLDDVDDQQTNANGVATMAVDDAGWYDIEVSHPDYNDECHLRKNVQVGNSDTFYLESL